jgi:hypothetical protein
VIVPSRPSSLRRRKQGIDFSSVEERHQPTGESLGRDGQHSLDLRRMGRASNAT